MSHQDEEKVTYFAETDSRNKRTPFGIKAKDRTRHVYVIGKTGMGKSTLLENMAIQDINNGNGLCFIDPHGKTAELFLDYVPEHRIKDVLYFAPFDMEFPISFNVMEDVGPDRRHLVVSGLMSAFKKIWVDAWSARMEYILNNTLLALLEYPGATLLSVNRMLADKDYRKKVVDHISDPSIKAFWVDEFAKYTERFAAEATPAIQNKVGQFTSNPLIRNIIGQPHSTFDIRKMMDERKILIINLSKGLVGETNANLLGSMLITKIYLAAMSRADVSQGIHKLPNFYLYVDEFQSFANESFADILSEARKYKLNLTIAHQYIEQMPEEVRAAVFGNVGTMITFRVGAFDAEVLEKEFAPYFEAQDLVNLGFVQIYLKLMIDGISSQPFSARTLPPIEKPIVSFKEQILANSRAMFAKPRAEVESNVREWHGPSPSSQPAKKPVSTTALPPVASSLPKQNNVSHVVPPSAQKPITAQPNIVQSPVTPATLKPPISKPQNNSFIKPSDVQNAIAKGDLAPISTSSKSFRKDDDKGPKPENVNSLRNALSSVLKDVKTAEQNRNPVPGKKLSAEPAQKITGNQPQPQVKKPNEVPEDVLRKILDTDV
jgi:energy-coupling factor transporter ATP-binding protein EcfA2